jgi:hypothetical protein
MSIGVLNYIWSETPSLLVRVGLTNIGQATIQYNQLNFGGEAWVRAESASGWAVRDAGLLAACPWYPGLLAPGSNISAIILLPPDTLRWQIGYKIRTASLRSLVASKIPRAWRNRLDPLCQRFLSGKEGPEEEVSSGLFECPPNFARLGDGEIKFPFDSEGFLPVTSNPAP